MKTRLTDLFLELNASNLALDLFGQEANASKIFCFFAPESMDMVNWQAKVYANADIPEWCGLFGAEIGLRVKGRAIRVERPVEQNLDERRPPQDGGFNLRLPLFDFGLGDLLAGGSSFCRDP